MIETGLSDFHKMTVALINMDFPKMKPRVIRYQKYKIFYDDAFEIKNGIYGQTINIS